MNTLVTIPRKKEGGITNYYKVIRKYLGKNMIYIPRGSFPGNVTILKRLSRIAGDYLKFIYSLVINEIDRVLINTNFEKGSLYRDLFYIFLSKIFKKKIFLFIHGWEEEYEQTFWHKNQWMVKLFCSCSAYIVLAETFSESLVRHNIKGSIFISSTMVDDTLTAKNPIIRNFGKHITILFLARIVLSKGIFESIDAFSMLRKKYSDSRLLVAGTGSELSAARKSVANNELQNVQFLGWVNGEQKAEIFKKAHLYIFPSSHGEGMPISVLEAMAFGLPVLTTPKGGIPDFFEEGKMGFQLETKDPEYIAQKIDYLLQRPDLMKKMSEYNFNYTKEHFYASKVAKRLKRIIDGEETSKGWSSHPFEENKTSEASKV